MGVILSGGPSATALSRGQELLPCLIVRKGFGCAARCVNMPSQIFFNLLFAHITPPVDPMGWHLLRTGGIG